MLWTSSASIWGLEENNGKRGISDEFSLILQQICKCLEPIELYFISWIVQVSVGGYVG